MLNPFQVVHAQNNVKSCKSSVAFWSVIFTEAVAFNPFQPSVAFHRNHSFVLQYETNDWCLYETYRRTETV